MDFDPINKRLAIVCGDTLQTLTYSNKTLTHESTIGMKLKNPKPDDPDVQDRSEEEEFDSESGSFVGSKYDYMDRVAIQPGSDIIVASADSGVIRVHFSKN